MLGEFAFVREIFVLTIYFDLESHVAFNVDCWDRGVIPVVAFAIDCQMENHMSSWPETTDPRLVRES